MTTHQDNAIRLARVAQIIAVIGVIAAVASFYPAKLKGVTSNISDRTNPGGNPGGAANGSKQFEVIQEDWLIALAPLNANHNPSVGIDGGPNGAGGIGGPGGEEGFGDEEPPPTPPTSNKDRPPIRYLGSLEDPKGFAALIDFAGRQVLLRIGQDFEDEFEITKISEEEITITDGFEEFTFELAQSSLQNALPTQLPQAPRGNPNAFPPGGRTPQNPNNPANQVNPRRPGKQDDDGGTPT